MTPDEFEGIDWSKPCVGQPLTAEALMQGAAALKQRAIEETDRRIACLTGKVPHAWIGVPGTSGRGAVCATCGMGRLDTIAPGGS